MTVFTEYSALDAIRLVLPIYCISVIVASLEYLSILNSFDDKGFYSWRLFREAGRPWRKPELIARVENCLFGKTGVAAILSLRVVAAIFVIFLSPASWSQWLALGILTAFSLLFAYRQRYGEDGSDQMSLIVGAVAVMSFGPIHTPVMVQLGLWFIALQSALSYLSAGVAKLISPIWRSGEAVGLIVNTASYGSAAAGAVLTRHPMLGRTLTWSTIAFELGFITVFFLPFPLVLLPLGLGVLFHAGIALVMGLNNFLWAFISTYPAVVFASLALQRMIFNAE